MKNNMQARKVNNKNMKKSVISVKNISKTFEYHKKTEGLIGSIRSLFFREKLFKEAVRSIDFEIHKGEFVGFLGPNGAGKTTTLKMLSGILTPTEGQLSVLGYNPSRREDEYKKRISIVMGQKSQLWPSLPAIETFRLFQKMYEIPDTQFNRTVNDLASLLSVKDLLDIQVRKLSLGQRMKCELIAALIHGPEVLFLDEPTIGLDVVSQQNIRNFLREYNAEKQTTIMLTSHYMDDVEDLCERIIILNQGQIGYDGSLRGIKEEYQKDKIIEVTFSKKVLKKDLVRFGKMLSYNPLAAAFAIPVADVQVELVEIMQSLPVNDLSVKDVTLEEIVADMFTEKKESR